MVEITVPDLTPQKLSPVGAVIDGGGLVLTSGDKRGPVSVPRNCTITGWRVVGDTSGSVVVDIYRSSGIDEYPPTSEDSIIDSNPPEVVDSIASESEDVSSWCGGTAQLNEGDILEFSISSVDAFRWVRIELFVEARA